MKRVFGGEFRRNLPRRPQRRCGGDDLASQRLGMTLDHIAPGVATLSMTLTDFMSNGHGNCHGGFLFSLADSAFAFACNSYNQAAVAQHCSITYLVPGKIGQRLTATATEVSRRGRSGIYDIRITNEDGEQSRNFADIRAR